MPVDEFSANELELKLRFFGAELILLTVIAKLWVSTAPLLSVAVNTTECDPTSELVGVPERTPVLELILNQDGTVVAA